MAAEPSVVRRRLNSGPGSQDQSVHMQRILEEMDADLAAHGSGTGAAAAAAATGAEASAAAAAAATSATATAIAFQIE